MDFYKLCALSLFASVIPLAPGSMRLATRLAAAVTPEARVFVSGLQGTETPAPTEQPKAYKLPPEKEAQAIAYAHSRHQLYFLDFLFTTVALALLIQLGVAPRLRDWAERITDMRFFQAVLFAGPFFVLLGLISLPGTAASHWLERYYAQSVQGWASWFWDALKGGVIALVLATFWCGSFMPWCAAARGVGGSTPGSPHSPFWCS